MKNESFQYVLAASSSESVSDQEFRILFLVNSFSRTKGYCHASNETLANMIGKSPKSVQRAISSLRKSGWLISDTSSGHRKLTLSAPKNHPFFSRLRGTNLSMDKSDHGQKRPDPLDKSDHPKPQKDKSDRTNLTPYYSTTIKKDYNNTLQGEKSEISWDDWRPPAAVHPFDMKAVDKNQFLESWNPDGLQDLFWLFRENPSQRTTAKWMHASEQQKKLALSRAPAFVLSASEPKYVGRLYTYIDQEKFNRISDERPTTHKKKSERREGIADKLFGTSGNT